MEEICVAFKAHQGWLNVVAVRMHARQPEPVYVQRVDLIEGDDREASEPYHVAGGWSGLTRVRRPADPEAVIRRGRRKQVEAARERLQQLRQTLEAGGFRWRRAVLLITRAWLGHSLKEILAYHSHIHVAEAEAVRDAARAAFEALELEAVEQDDKSVAAEAERRLGCRDCDLFMKPRRPAAPGSSKAKWRKEERLIALAAWLHAS